VYKCSSSLGLCIFCSTVYSAVQHILLYDMFCCTLCYTKYSPVLDIRLESICTLLYNIFICLIYSWFIIFSASQYIFLYDVVRYSCCATYSSVCYILLYTKYSAGEYIMLYDIFWYLIYAVVSYIQLYYVSGV
jgi:hypothetical protein